MFIRVLLILLGLYSFTCHAVLSVEQCQSMQLLVPAYFYPTTWAPTTDLWAAMKSLDSTGIAVMNPNSGPGTSANSDYTAALTMIRAPGWLVIGYVYTSYGQRASADVKADIDAYFNFYPGLIDGIFFDEVATSSDLVSYYKTLTGYARDKSQDTYLFVTLNPGTPPSDDRYIDMANTTIIFESGWTDFQSSDLATVMQTRGWATKYSASKFSQIVYNVPSASLNTAIQKIYASHTTYAFVTDDVLPNPYDTLPPYISTESTTLSSICNSNTGSNPSPRPTGAPTARSTTAMPSRKPTSKPSFRPTVPVTSKPTALPSALKSAKPSSFPTVKPSNFPSAKKSPIPSRNPTTKPTLRPSASKTAIPSKYPSHPPSLRPSATKSSVPSRNPTAII